MTTRERKAKSSNEEEDTVGVLEVDWTAGIPDAPSAYANHMFSQVGQHEFILTFFHLAPPLTVGTPEEQMEQIRALGKLKPNCVSRVIVPHELMPDIIRTLQENYNSLLSRKRTKQDNSNE